MITTMNTSVNQTFDWSRFTATLRKELVENKRGILFTVICIYGLLTLMMIIGNLIGHNPVSMQEMLDVKAPQIVVGMILTLVVCVSASMAFIGLKTKTSRASYLTSPSSTFEKFVVNILIYVVGIFIAYFACAQLADLTRIAVLWYFKGENFAVHGPINFLTCLSDVASIYDEPELGLKCFDTMVIVGLIANAGLYLLGSVIWPRLSLLKTFAAVYAIEFAVFIIAAPLFYFFGDGEALAEWFIGFITGGKFSISMICITAIQAVLYFSLAWYLFKRKDVISLKWWK
jgi:hypothetical protein